MPPRRSYKLDAGYEMAGPVAGVITTLDASALTSNLRMTLQAIGTALTVTPADQFDAYISNTRPIGGEYCGEGRPFLCDVQPANLDDAERKSILQTFGIVPSQEYILMAMCNSPEDHRILAQLALYFAKKHGAVVDLGGALLPPSWRTTDTSLISWCEVSEDSEVWARSIPGTVLSIPYATGDGRLWATHLVDAIFLDNWLRNPDFHMIK